MSSYVLRPIADVFNSGGGINKIGSSAAYWQILSDQSDATYLQLFGTSYSQIEEQMSTLSLGVNEYITQYRYVVRADAYGVGAANLSAQVFDVVGNSSYITNWQPNFSSPANYYSQWYTTPPSGNAFIGSTDFEYMEVTANNAGSGTDPNVFDIWIEVQTNNSPVAVATGPVATSVTTRPVVTWTYSDADGDAQERFQVRAFTAAQVAAPGFDPRPGHTVAVVESGETFSSATSWQVTADLQNGVQYYFYVLVADANSGGHYNYMTNNQYLVNYSTTTISILPPAVPAIINITQQKTSGETITIQDRQNILTQGDSNFEDTVSYSWQNVLTNCTVSRVAHAANNGAYVWQIVASAAGNFGLQTASYDNFVGGQIYSAIAYLSSAVSRSAHLDIIWLDASFATISTSAGPTLAENTSGYTPIYVSAVAPSNAAHAVLRMNILGATGVETHYMDTVNWIFGALNMLYNPVFELDSNADGVADSWAFNDPAATVVDPAPTMALDTSVVWGGVSSQRMKITANTGYKGIVDSGYILNAASGTTYTVSAWVRTTTAASFQLRLGLAFSSSIAVPANTWTRVSAQLTALASGNLSVGVFTTALASTVWFGHVQLELGTFASLENTSFRPFTNGSQLTDYWEIQRSSDGGVTWTSFARYFVNGSTLMAQTALPNYRNGLQQLALTDWEASRNAALLYRVRAIVPAGSTAQVASQWSRWFPQSALPATDVVISDPTDPTRTITVGLDQLSIDLSRDESETAHYAMGRAAPFVVHGTIRKGTFPVALAFKNDAAYDAWKVLQDSQRVLLLQSPYGDSVASQFYFTIDPTVNKSIVTHDAMKLGQIRRVSFTARETVAP